MDLKVCTLWGIHTYKKDRSTQVLKCSPWGPEVKPYPFLQKKMAEFMKHRQIIAMPFANRSFKPRPKVAAGKCNLVTLTRPNREKLSLPRKINVRLFHLVAQQNWLATLKCKEVEDATSSQTPTPSQPIETPATQSPTSPVPPEHTKYCPICTPLGKISLMNSLCLWTGMMMMTKKKEKTRMKEKTKMIAKGRHPKPAPDSYWLLPLLLSPPNHLSNSSARGPV